MATMKRNYPKTQPKFTTHRKTCAVCGLRSAGQLCTECRADLGLTLARLEAQRATIEQRIASTYQSLQEALSRATAVDLDRFTKVEEARTRNAPEFAKRYAVTLELSDGLGAIVRAEKAYRDTESDQRALTALEVSGAVVRAAIEERKADEAIRAAGVDWQRVDTDIVIVAGTRTVEDYSIVDTAIKASGFNPARIVSGKQKSYNKQTRQYYGVDYFGEMYAELHNIPVDPFPADWDTHGKAAGPIRNQAMANYATALVAVWDGTSHGTKDMIERAKKNNLKVYIHRY